MKKRIMSMLLAVLMVLSLFSGLTVSAHAATTTGANTIQYTMQNGDYVLRICQKLGLNYYTCKDAIMALNNINEGQWSKLAVGRVLTLPASDYDAILISSGAGLTYNSSGSTATTATTGTATTGTSVTYTGTASTATTSTVTQNATARSADTLAYYLVPYTMSLGETVSGVCNNLGVNFNIFQSFIRQVNGISSWTQVRAGQTLIIPTPVCPSVGTTCYGVMQHKVASNDTAYSIVSNNGVNYNANKTLLEALNQTNNLAAIKAGENFFYPVPMTVSVPGTGNPGSTTTTTTTTTVTDGNGSVTTSTTTTSKLYKLSSSMSSSDGTMLFYVNNEPVTAAPAGAKVTIVTNTYSGKAISGLTVKYANGTADLKLSGDSFIMPSCDARVDATVSTGHDIDIIANYSGKAGASVGGVSVQSAVKGAAVVIKSTDPNYEIQSIYAYYKKLISSSTKTQITVSSSNAFIMPDADVTVEVVLKPVSTYAFYVNDPVNGSFYLQVNGSAVTRAAKGATVTVVAKALDGYEPTSLKVVKHGGTETVNVFSNTFTMPAFDVDVTVEFGPKGNNILIMPTQVGIVYAFKNSGDTLPDWITEGETGQDIYLKLYDEDDNLITGGYNVSYDVVRNSDGLNVKVTHVSGLIYKFTMPKGGVTITPNVTSAVSGNITSKIFINGSATTGYKDCSFSVTWNGKTSEFTKTGDQVKSLKAIKQEIPYGEYIDLRFDCTDEIAFIRYRITLGDGSVDEQTEEATNEANLHGYFKMPDGSIIIEAYFESGKVPIGPAAIVGVGTVSYRVDGKSVNSCDPGDTVTMIVTPGNGYKFDETAYKSKLFVTRKDNGAYIEVTKINATTYTFVMPGEGADVMAYFDAKPFVITMKCYDEVGNNLTGKGLWQVGINWVAGIVDNDPSKTETKFDVAYEDYVTVAMTEAGWSNYDMVSFRIDGHEYVADVKNYFYNFQMIEERAKDLEIIAILRPRVPTSPNVYSLSALYDATKGNVEFILLDKDPVTGSPSATNYASNINGENYYATVGTNKLTNARFTKNAFAGDYVAIVCNSTDSKYIVNQDNLSIVPVEGDANRIIPTRLDGWTINGDNNGGAGYTLYVFKMPESSLNITVNFTGTRNILRIHVRDKDGVNPVSGMIRLFANNIYRDVASDDTFDTISYMTQVQILRSELAIAEGMKISAVDIQTASGDVSYYDLSNAGEGIWFNMPDETVDVYIRVDKQSYNLPVIMVDQVYNGTLIFRSGPNVTDPIVTDANIGDTLYVFPYPFDGYDYLQDGDLKVYINGTLNSVNLVNAPDPAHPENNVWQFVVQAGTTIFQATFPEKVPTANEIEFIVSGGPAQIIASVGTMSDVFTSGDTIYVYGDTVINMTAPDGYKIASMTSASGRGVLSTETYWVPEDLAGYTDTLTITLTEASNLILKASSMVNGDLQFSNGKDMKQLIDSQVTGQTVYILDVPGSDCEITDLKVVSIENETNVSVTALTPTLAEPAKWSFTMPAGGVVVNATFKTKTVKVTINVLDGATLLPVADPINVSIGGDTPMALTHGQSVLAYPGQVITYSVPSGSDYTLTDILTYTVGGETTQTTTAFIRYF